MSTSSDNNNQQQQNQNQEQQQNIAKGFIPPSKNNPNPSSTSNPLTPEEIQKKIDEENQNKQYNQAREHQMAVKFRTEDQGFKYTPPKGMENDPLLQPTPDKNALKQQLKSQEIDPNLGEEQINNIQSEDQPQQPQQQVKKANVQVDQQQNQSQHLKG